MGEEGGAVKEGRGLSEPIRPFGEGISINSGEEIMQVSFLTIFKMVHQAECYVRSVTF